MKCPRCQRDNPVADAQFCPRCGAPVKHAEESGPSAASYADLRRELKARDRELTEALEQQTATSEILAVISSSPTDVEPVFRTILANANTLCGANFALLWLWDDEVLTAVAHENVSPALAENVAAARVRPHRRNPVGLSILEQAVVHVVDVLADPRFAPENVPTYRLEGARSILSVPMLREGTLVGVINIWRREPRAFTDGQIALVRTFADQAVIAIENVRLFKELEARNRDLTQSLDQQTATSDILRVISSSPTDVQPVFNVIAESAACLCEAFDANIFSRDGDRLLLVAHWGSIPTLGPVGEATHPLVRGTTAGRAMLDAQAVHVLDIQTEVDEFPESSALGRQLGIRTLLSVPLVRESVALGAISLRRTEARLFTDRQVALLQTFADQAVIAIENVRLFKELEARNLDLTQALEQQTATSEILRVIGSSPTDTQPVFDAIVVSARRLLGGFSCGVYRRLGDEVDIAAYTSTTPAGDAAVRSLYPRPLDGVSFSGEAIRTGSIIVSTDIETDPRIVPEWRAAIRVRGFRSAVWVPMLREGAAIGAIGVTRSEPGAFGDEQIALLKTFADQAMIAVENVRLFEELQASNRELRTALDTQTATSDILGVISRSPTDVQPVFDAILGSAVRLLGAYSGVLTRIAGDQIVLAALTSSDDAGDAATRALFPQALQAELSNAGQWDKMAAGYALAIRERGPVNIADAHTDPRWPEAARAYARLRGYRSWVAVPMLRHDGAIGTISVTRREPGGFTDDEIGLLKTFADQAVIAIENVRLFTELGARNRALTETLEQQTATSDILRVISSSPTNVQPTFEAIAVSATQLCDAVNGLVIRFDGELMHLAAHHNLSPERLDALNQVFPMPPNRGTVTGRAIMARAVAHVPDITRDPEYALPSLTLVGYRTALAVPMLREGIPIGGIVVARDQVAPFSEKQVELLKTFADQAVIAIENVRLFTELQEKNRALTEALDQQTATSEVLKTISRSTFDLQPVLETLVENAARL